MNNSCPRSAHPLNAYYRDLKLMYMQCGLGVMGGIRKHRESVGERGGPPSDRSANGDVKCLFSKLNNQISFRKQWLSSGLICPVAELKWFIRLFPKKMLQLTLQLEYLIILITWHTIKSHWFRACRPTHSLGVIASRDHLYISGNKYIPSSEREVSCIIEHWDYLCLPHCYT